MDQPIRPKRPKPRIRPHRGEFHVMVANREIVAICRTLAAAFSVAGWRFIQELA